MAKKGLNRYFLTWLTESMNKSPPSSRISFPEKSPNFSFFIPLVCPAVKNLILLFDKLRNSRLSRSPKAPSRTARILELARSRYRKRVLPYATAGVRTGMLFSRRLSHSRLERCERVRRGIVVFLWVVFSAFSSARLGREQASNKTPFPVNHQDQPSSTNCYCEREKAKFAAVSSLDPIQRRLIDSLTQKDLQKIHKNRCRRYSSLENWNIRLIDILVIFWSKFTFKINKIFKSSREIFRRVDP